MAKIAGTLSFVIWILSASLNGIQSYTPQEAREALKKNHENLLVKVDEDQRQYSIKHLNYPITYWNQYWYKLERSKECVKFPHPYSVHFANFYWQKYTTNNITLLLHNSYLDNRKHAGTPTVRILAMINRDDPRLNLQCLLYFNDSVKPVVSRVTEIMNLWPRVWLTPGKTYTIYLPFLLNCPLPSNRVNEIPRAVTLSAKPCEQTSNVLKVSYDKPKTKKSIAICVKGMDFPFWDVTLQLIEWIEMNRLLGVDKIIFYKFQVHPKVEKMLQYYTRIGYVEVTPLTLSQGQAQDLRAAKHFLESLTWYEELISYNDCWNKNMYKYDYISLIDIDELIVPLKANTWKEVINLVDTENRKKNKPKPSSYCFREARFSTAMLTLPDIPPYMTKMRRVLRTPFAEIGYQTKCIQDTENVLTLHNHYYTRALKGYDRIHETDLSIAQLNHYRNCHLTNQPCLEINKNNGTIDLSLFKYLKPLKSRMNDAISKMGIDTKQK